MSKSLVDTCIYETYWSIKLLPHANSTDIIDISTDIDTDIISVSLLNFIDIAISVLIPILISVHLYYAIH